jgi:hypothetical protein
MRKTLSKMVLEQRPTAGRRIEVRDKESPLVFRLTDKGDRTLCVRTRIGRQQVRLTYPKAAVVENLSEARVWAHQTVDDCGKGIDPRKAQATSEAASKRAAELAERRTFANVAMKYIDRRVRKEKDNRTADGIERTFEIYFLPRWRELSVMEITRSDVNEAIDEIYDGKVEFEGKLYGGNVAADRALAQLRACFNWFATQDDKFNTPIVKGMARTNPKKRERERVLTDEEIHVLWTIAPNHGVFGKIVQTLLLSAQRRSEVAFIARSEIARQLTANSKPGDWTIPSERYKTDCTVIVPLSSKALAIIDEQDQIGDCDLVFTTNGETAFSGFGKCKDRLDAEMLAALRNAAEERGDRKEADKMRKLEALLETITTTDDEDARDHARDQFRKVWWTLHDLRRTAKTLMSRAGVRPDISERVLGHVIDGVEGVYDRYEYLEEKRDALERLATQIERIINPPVDNVVRLAR